MESALFNCKNVIKRALKSKAVLSRALVAKGLEVCISDAKQGGKHSNVAVSLCPHNCRHIPVFPFYLFCCFPSKLFASSWLLSRAVAQRAGLLAGVLPFPLK